MKKRILVCEPDPDVRSLLELIVSRLGHELAVEGDDPDAVVMEPSCPVAHSWLRRLGRGKPVVCLSIYGADRGYAPPETVEYLMKPVKASRLGAALDSVLTT